MKITPGYDFETHGVPTRALLGLMASGMSVRDISLYQLDSGLILLSVSDDSLPSLAGEGWLWFDARGNLWGRTSHGQVIVRKCDGGWESSRYPQSNANTASVYKIPGTMVQVGEIIANNTNESNVRFVDQVGGFSTAATWHPGILQETVASTNSNTYNWARIVFAGQTRVFAPDFMPASVERMRVWRATANSNWWVMSDISTANVNAYSGDLCQNDYDNASSIDYAYMYFFQHVLSL
jgi:hypothetical protein